MAGSTAGDALDEEEEEGQIPQHPKSLTGNGGRLRNITVPSVQR